MQERESLADQLSALQASSASELQELATKLEAGEAEKANLRDQVRAAGHSRETSLKVRPRLHRPRGPEALDA